MDAFTTLGRLRFAGKTIDHSWVFSLRTIIQSLHTFSSTVLGIETRAWLGLSQASTYFITEVAPQLSFVSLEANTH